MLSCSCILIAIRRITAAAAPRRIAAVIAAGSATALWGVLRPGPVTSELSVHQARIVKKKWGLFGFVFLVTLGGMTTARTSFPPPNLGWLWPARSPFAERGAHLGATPEIVRAPLGPCPSAELCTKPAQVAS